MNIGTSSFTIAITRCNIPYTDDIYRVVANSYCNNTYAIPRRYIQYTTFSNQYSFPYFPPGLCNGSTYCTLNSLRPDEYYYYTTDLKNKLTSNYVRIYNGLTVGNFTRTSLPIAPITPPISSLTIGYDISNNPIYGPISAFIDISAS